MGRGGAVEVDAAKRDLVSTLGVNVRTDFPVARYILLGPQFQLGAWRPDGPNAPARSYYFDIDFRPALRLPLQADKTAFQLWLAVPIGLTLNFLDEEIDPTLEGLAFGWNYAFAFGGAVHFSKKFGMFAEVGWMSHRFSHNRAEASGKVDFEITQTLANFGFIFGS
jgi:hypothetical protein